MAPMTPFGHDSISYTHGYDLPILLSHLEGLLDGEVDAAHSKGIARKAMHRIELVEKAIGLLDEAAAIGKEV
jgi:hypothetical protein